ncbi:MULTISPECIES: hypothetical protein [Streptomyces]|uniref:Uncharacterized protein n=2 Tax=Streptomyces rimosus subsp. rimosus TaxID=132474 RepID=A0A8A1UQN0_STRR1|nr:MULTISPECIES: hypothetical protein [Streptomyces]MYT44426.1 hypothetical protein [Streptomyces sp. SID5471]QGY65554.1 hypothetical protein V519_006250 [Streptomyces rimosus R6-500]QST82477.1 hypothetical protein SRIM_022005 [Streptomyces rimosus subsp. rimosus ATCC 10970]QTL87604.1 hypothetical protein FMM49_19310 [Streptomyces rimosus subsp. rimosus]UNZ04211.1 hypothetical protein SRIMR7_18810 [Streptomyces rimosus subsp. rimosus]
MSEPQRVRNELSGTVNGNAIQAGAIHGDVVFGAPTSPESEELQRRLEQRQRRILDAEDAQAAEIERRCEQYLKRLRWGRRAAVIMLPFAIPGVVMLSAHGWILSGWQGRWGLFGLPVCALGLYSLAFSTWVIKRAEAGKPIKIPPRTPWSR